jgi:hypothetical protein
LVFVGVIGEYIGAVHTQVLKRPLVVERERLNFAPRVAPIPESGSPVAVPQRDNRRCA